MSQVDSIIEMIDKDYDVDLQMKIKIVQDLLDVNLIIFDYDSEKKEELRNTLQLIENKIETLYFNMLEKILPVLQKWGFSNLKTGFVPKSVEDLHETRLPNAFIEDIQINCLDIRDEMAVFSVIFRFNYFDYGYDDGIEAVFIHDKLVFWSDGNAREYLFDFEKRQNEVGYIGM